MDERGSLGVSRGFLRWEEEKMMCRNVGIYVGRTVKKQ